jgi:hypothetical protein
METEKILEIYERERNYQNLCFGEYSEIKKLNPASFLAFIRKYLNEAEEAYCGPWSKEVPEWLKDCYELEEGTAPAEMYANIIKVMALAGALLETYIEILPEKWRSDPLVEGQKWLKEKFDKGVLENE